MLRVKRIIFSNMRILFLISSILVFNCMQHNKHTINYSRQNMGYSRVEVIYCYNLVSNWANRCRTCSKQIT